MPRYPRSTTTRRKLRKLLGPPITQPPPTGGGGPTAGFRVTPAEFVPRLVSGSYVYRYGIRTFVGSARHGHAYRYVAGNIDFTNPVTLVSAGAGITVSLATLEDDAATQVASGRLTITGTVAGEWDLVLACGGDQVTMKVIVEPGDPMGVNLPAHLVDFEDVPPSADAPRVTFTDITDVRTKLAAPVRGTVYVVPALADWTNLTTTQIPVGLPTGAGKGWTYILGAPVEAIESSTRRLTSGEMATMPALRQNFNNQAVLAFMSAGNYFLRMRGIKLESGATQDICYGLLLMGGNVAGSLAARHLHLTQSRIRGRDLPTYDGLYPLAGVAPTVNAGANTSTLVVTGSALPALVGTTYIRVRKVGATGFNEQKPFVGNATSVALDATTPGGRFAVTSITDNGNGTSTLVVSGQLLLSDITTNTEQVELWINGGSRARIPCILKGVVANGEHQSISACDFETIAGNTLHAGDGHAILCYSGAGPYAWRNNKFHTPITSAWQTGGAGAWDVTAVPKDVHAELNDVSRLGYPSAVCGGWYTMKNPMEWKVGIRLLCEKNKFDWSPRGDLNQYGYGLQGKSQPYLTGGQSTYADQTLQHCVWRHNLLSRCAGFLEISASQNGDQIDPATGVAAQVLEGTHHVHLHDNLSMAVLPTMTPTQGNFIKSITNAPTIPARRLRHFSVRCNTHLQPTNGTAWGVGDFSAPNNENLTVQGNMIAGHSVNHYIFTGTGTGYTDANAFNVYVVTYTKNGNVFYRMAGDAETAFFTGDTRRGDPFTSGDFAGNVLTSLDPNDYRVVAPTATIPDVVIDGVARRPGADIDAVIAHTALAGT